MIAQWQINDALKEWQRFMTVAFKYRLTDEYMYSLYKEKADAVCMVFTIMGLQVPLIAELIDYGC